MTRRAFVASTAATALAAAAQAASHTPIGVDSYTVRAFGWKAFELLDYAVKVGVDEVHFSEWPHIGSYDQVRDEAYLRRVKARADELGLHLEMGTWVICPTNPRFERNRKYGSPEEQLRFAIGIARIFEAKTIRCVIGSGHLRREDGPIEKHIESTIQVFQNVREDALRAGVHIAPENHKDLRAGEMRGLVEAAGTDYVGAIIDTGNPMEVLEDPMETVETLAPVAVGSHFRDSILWKHPQGAAFQWTAMGEGSVRIGEVVRRYVELCPGKPVTLEIITGRAPAILPYQDPEFLEAFPKMKAVELMRFERLAERGHPFMGGMLIPNAAPDNPAYREAMKEQQRIDFERSVQFLREEVGL